MVLAAFRGLPNIDLYILLYHKSPNKKALAGEYPGGTASGVTVAVRLVQVARLTLVARVLGVREAVVEMTPQKLLDFLDVLAVREGPVHDDLLARDAKRAYAVPLGRQQ